MKILIHTMTDPAPVARALGRTDGLDVRVAVDRAEFEREIDGAEGLVLGNSRYQAMEQAIVERGRRLRWIQFSSSGYDALRREKLRPDIIVTRAVGVWTPVVAAHAVALSLALLRQLPAFAATQASRQWAGPATVGRLRSLAGMKVLVVGYGDVGKAFAALVEAFGAQVTAVASRARIEDGTAIHGVDELPALLAVAELVVLTAPGSSDGRPLLGPAELERLPASACLVNVGRGSLIDEAALCERLGSGQLAGAALDVTATEPLPADSPLWSAPNLILTPHVAGQGDAAALERLGRLCAANALALLNGEPMKGSL